MKQCTQCGHIVNDPEALFCEECGGVLQEVPMSNTQPQAEDRYENNDYYDDRYQDDDPYGDRVDNSRRSGGSNVGKIIGIAAGAIVALVVVIVIVVTVVRHLGNSSNVEETTASSAATEQQGTRIAGNDDESEAEDAAADIDVDYDYDCRDGNEIELTGTLQGTSDGYKLKLDDGASFLVENDDGSYSVYQDFKTLNLSISDDLSNCLNKEVSVTGTITASDSTLYMDPYSADNVVLLDDGEEEETETVAASDDEEEEEEADAEDDDYIFADSNSRYLNNSDVAGMTAKEVNYAKNEIYARHGRKFNSSELQSYFNSKSWYTGTVDPDDFDSAYVARVMNSYERENLKFLAEKEQSLGGYTPS